MEEQEEAAPVEEVLSSPTTAVTERWRAREAGRHEREREREGERERLQQLQRLSTRGDRKKEIKATESRSLRARPPAEAPVSESLREQRNTSGGRKK